MRNFAKQIMAIVALALAAPVLAASLNVGDAAPDFSLQGSDGKRIRYRNFVANRLS
jgi:hypothetical protein